MGRYDVEKEKWDERASKRMAQSEDLEYTKSYEQIFNGQNTLRPVYGFFDRIGQPGIRVLDFGCGRGWATIALAKKAESVKGFDISEKSVELVRKRLDYNGLSNAEVQAADGEVLPYENEEFDYVFGNAILHHLQLDKCLPEIARVLKPGGRAAFCEPLRHNPVINLLRYARHHLFSTHVGTDQPLKFSDAVLFERYFKRVKFKESSFFKNNFVYNKTIDQFFLKFKPLQRYSAYVTILLEK